MKFPRNIFPYLYELQRLEELGLKQESYDFRKDFNELLWKEYKKRLDLIECRALNLGGDKKIHKIE
jgi:hypothetical protein